MVVAPQADGRDQHELVDPFATVGRRDLRRDHAAEDVPDDRGPLDARGRRTARVVEDEIPKVPTFSSPVSSPRAGMLGCDTPCGCSARLSRNGSQNSPPAPWKNTTGLPCAADEHPRLETCRHGSLDDPIRPTVAIAVSVPDTGAARAS